MVVGEAAEVGAGAGAGAEDELIWSRDDFGKRRNGDISPEFTHASLKCAEML